MEMILQVLLLVLGFLMLVKGADWFVDGASGIAERFGIPQLVVGLTIVAMGTSMPEAAVSINSARIFRNSFSSISSFMRVIKEEP